jgi:hypothetical protein
VLGRIVGASAHGPTVARHANETLHEADAFAGLVAAAREFAAASADLHLAPGRSSDAEYIADRINRRRGQARVGA